MYGHIVWRIFTKVSVKYAASVTVFRPDSVPHTYYPENGTSKLKYRLIIFKFKNRHDST